MFCLFNDKVVLFRTNYFVSNMEKYCILINFPLKLPIKNERNAFNEFFKTAKILNTYRTECCIVTTKGHIS